MLTLPAGISQSYISQWLLQQGLEMSDSKRRAFYRWYLLERNNPGEAREGSRAPHAGRDDGIGIAHASGLCVVAVTDGLFFCCCSFVFLLSEWLFMPRLHRPAWPRHTPPIPDASSTLVLQSCELWEETSLICKFVSQTEVKRSE